MRVGKLTEAVEDRAVVRVLQKEGMEPTRLATQEQPAGGQLVAATAQAGLSYECQGSFLMDQVIGLLYSEGVWNPVLALTASVPSFWEEADLKKFTRMLKAYAEQKGVSDYVLHARVQNGIEAPILSLTGSGLSAPLPVREGFFALERENEAAIVMAGYAALEATACMICAKGERLQKHLSGQYLQGAMEASMKTDMRQAIRLAKQRGALVKLAGEGGIFAALWELGRYLDSGMTVALRKILLRQETIEVCEVLDVSPYQVLSTGSILAVTKSPDKLLEEYQAAGIPAKEIGKLTKGKDRILPGKEEQRYLEPFRGDEIYKAGILHL